MLVRTKTQFLTLLSPSFRSTFNPADYAEPAQTEENYGGGSTWNNTGSVDLEEGASKLMLRWIMNKDFVTKLSNAKVMLSIPMKLLQ